MAKSGLGGIPRGVWALGLVSLFMDLSSEMIHAVLPLFLVAGLGVGAATVGLIEGVAEAVASITKAFSGALSDRLGKRKALAVAGYGLAALSKPLFPLAAGPALVLFARFIDRIGKGIRGAPRDALVADLTPQSLRGAAFGLRQALDTVGALLGPLAAAALMVATGNSFRAVFWAALAPAVVCVAVLVVMVKEPPAPPQTAASAPLRFRDMGKLGPALWSFIWVTALLSLARFSEAFVLLRGADIGLSLAAVPLLLVVMNGVYAAVAYPAGRLSDRIGRNALVVAGFAVLAVSDVVLALAGEAWMVFVGAALWGAHLGLTQGVLTAMVADLAPRHLRGTAFGMFHMASGLALLTASLLAGWLWESFSPVHTFTAGGLAAAAGVVAFLAWGRRWGG